jgi:hypothetical protein
MSAQQQEREALQQHDQAGATKRQPKAKGPEVHVKKAPAKPAKPTLTATAKKRLEELTAEIEKIERLKDERVAVMRKEHERGVPTTEIAGPAGYSVARARQLLGK